MNSIKRRAYRRAAREACFDHYGNTCACCGESERAFLTLDHVAKDGAAHRLKIGTGGHLCEVLRNQQFPPGFQVLCHNCNWARSALGVCPHQDASKAWDAYRPPTPPPPRAPKLSPSAEADIRAKYTPYHYSMRDLAAEYGVSLGTVWRVIKGQSGK